VCLSLSQETPVSDKHNELHLCFIQKTNDLQGNSTLCSLVHFPFEIRSLEPIPKSQQFALQHTVFERNVLVGLHYSFARGKKLQGNNREKFLSLSNAYYLHYVSCFVHRKKNSSELLCNWYWLVQLRLSGMSSVECWKLSSVSANITVAIFRVNVCWLGVFRSLK
jgi:hypothetical protein